MWCTQLVDEVRDGRLSSINVCYLQALARHGMQDSGAGRAIQIKCSSSFLINVLTQEQKKGELSLRGEYLFVSSRYQCILQ